MPVDPDDDEPDDREECFTCDGTGKVFSDLGFFSSTPCPDCDGTGKEI